MKVILEIGFYIALTAIFLGLLALQSQLARSAWGSRWWGAPSLGMMWLMTGFAFVAWFFHDDWFGDTSAVGNDWVALTYTLGPIIWLVIVAAGYNYLVGQGSDSHKDAGGTGSGDTQ